jgi:hypothetical protein
MKEFIHQIQIDHNITSRIPGYLLVENLNENLKADRIIEEGINKFFGGFGENAHIFDLGSYLFALLMPEELPKLNCISFVKEDGDFAFLEGTFYDYDLLKKNKSELISNNLAREVLVHTRKQEYAKLKEYNGRYSGFVYIKQTNELVLITDRYGANRVFVYQNSNTFVVSNNIFALSMNPGLKVSINELSIAEILHYEYPAHRGTEFNEIELVLPSDILIRQNQKNTFSKFYQKLSRKPLKSDIEYINELRSAIDGFFKKTSNYLDEPMGIYLSKGKDSRIFLPFLERNNIPYVPFVFREDTGIFDYPEVIKIARLLDKDLHVLDKHVIDQNLAFLMSMSTTFTTPWVGLGKVAGNYVSNALMGLYGESSSGKLSAHRHYGVSDRESTIQYTIVANARGVTKEDSDKWMPYFAKFDTDASFRKIYDEYPPVEIPFDYDTYQDIDHRSFRNAVVILLKAQHFITPITPAMDTSVAEVYHKLPKSLLKSQYAHTAIAAEENKSNKIRSTAFPISLKLEKDLRPLLMELIKINHSLKDFFLNSQKKRYKPFVDTEIFIPKSDYFKEILEEKKIYIGNPRILTRLYNIDNYLHMTLSNKADNFFKKPVIVNSELTKVKPDIGSSIVN